MRRTEIVSLDVRWRKDGVKYSLIVWGTWGGGGLCLCFTLLLGTKKGYLFY